MRKDPSATILTRKSAAIATSLLPLRRWCDDLGHSSAGTRGSRGALIPRPEHSQFKVWVSGEMVERFRPERRLLRRGIFFIGKEDCAHDKDWPALG